MKFTVGCFTVLAGFVVNAWCYEEIPREDWGAVEPIELSGGHSLEPMGKVDSITVHHTHDLPPDKDTEVEQVQYLQELHIDGKIAGRPTKYGDIAYHFVIAPSGKVYLGRSLDYRGNSNTRYVSKEIRHNSKYHQKTRWSDGTIENSIGSIDLWRPGKDGTKMFLDGMGVPPNPGQIGDSVSIVFLGNFDPPAKEKSAPQPTPKAKAAFVELCAELLRTNNALSISDVYLHRECAMSNCPGDGIYSWLRGDKAQSDGAKPRPMGDGLKALHEQSLK